MATLAKLLLFICCQTRFFARRHRCAGPEALWLPGWGSNAHGGGSGSLRPVCAPQGGWGCRFGARACRGARALARRRIPPQRPVGLKLPQQKTERTLPPAFSRARNAVGKGYALRNPAPRMGVVNTGLSRTGYTRIERKERLHGSNIVFCKCIKKITNFNYSY